MEFLHLATTRVARGGHTQLGSTIGTFLALANIHSKSEKVCGTAFSVKKKIAEKVQVILGPFWVIFGPLWAILGHFGHFWAILWHFWTNLRKVQIFLRDSWGQDPRF